MALGWYAVSFSQQARLKVLGNLYLESDGVSIATQRMTGMCFELSFPDVTRSASIMLKHLSAALSTSTKATEAE